MGWSANTRGVVGRCRQKPALVRRLGHGMLKAALTRDIFPSQSGFPVLMTTPAPPDVYGPEPVEQWRLFQPSGEVLTIRSDGMYTVEPGNTTPADARWMPLHEG